jgi:hypothetical protein
MSAAMTVNVADWNAVDLQAQAVTVLNDMHLVGSKVAPGSRLQ